jgi:putative transposase
MESYKRGSHTVWDCKYHIVWVTKYRFAILGGDVGQRCRELVRETARAYEMVIHAGSINRDHVHLLVSIPPSLSVSRAVQYLKGVARISCLQSLPACANGIGGSTSGHEATGSQAAVT